MFMKTVVEEGSHHPPPARFKRRRKKRRTGKEADTGSGKADVPEEKLFRKG